MQKSVAFLYTNNDQKKKKKTIYNCIRKNKYLGINLIKKVEYLYSETAKHWWKKLKMLQTNGKLCMACSWIGRINIIKVTIQSNLQIQCNLYHNAKGIFFKLNWNKKF